MAEHGLSAPAGFLRRTWRAEKPVSLLLLFILLSAALAGVGTALRGPDWGLLWSSLLFGLLAGWGLAILGQPALRSAGIGLVLGFLVTLFITADIAGQLGAIFAVVFQSALRNAYLPPNASVGLVPLALNLQLLARSLGVLFGRVDLWLAALAGGQPVFDPVAAALVWRLLVWSMAFWAGWVVEARRSALLAALPAVLLSLGTLSSGQRNPATLYWVLGAVLVLLATVGQDRRELGWEQNRIPYPARKGRQIGCVATLVAIGLVLAALLVATFSIQRIGNWFTRTRGPAVAQPGGLAASLGIQAAATPVPDAFAQARRPGLPRQLLIGSGPELSGEVVMSVQVLDLSGLSQGGHPLPFYWRSYTYDVYTGTGWRTSATQQTQAGPDQPLGPDHLPDHVLVQQVVRPVSGQGGLLYAAGEPVAVNQASQSAWRSQTDLFGVELEQGGAYQVSSLMPFPSVNQLRQAGQHYPDWVLNRYLELPAEVPERVKSLAIQLTAGQPTPYDRAKAIETYLRKIPYTLDLPYPPPNRDLADYFLFDLRKGYCDYYASAMVVLARAAGIPARLAVGYASGEFNLNAGRFVVTQADAHSWVEVYFPKIGWVTFEPTAALPNLDATQQSGAPAIQMTPLPAAPSETGAGWPSGRGWLLPMGVLAVLVLGIAAWYGFDSLRLGRLTGKALAAEIYRRMRSWGRRLGATVDPGSMPGVTPYEFSAVLSARLQGRNGAGSSFREQISNELLGLTQEIVQECYRPQRPGGSPAMDILTSWRRLRWRLLRVWLSDRWAMLNLGRWMRIDKKDAQPDQAVH